MDSLLPYEYEIIENALADDSLNVIARGLCMEKIFAHMLKAFCVRTNLVIVVNAAKDDVTCFLDYLWDADAAPCSLTTETTNSVTERVKIYKSGGVLFVTSRILVLDFLTNRIPFDFLTALFIYRAERLLLSHQEAFITRLYRQKNTTGRICAFSEVPTAFMSAHGKADRVMRMCNLKRLNIWPRFRSSIAKCFDSMAPEVIENQTKITPLMLKIQGNVLELIKACCAEIKRDNPSLDQEEFSVDSVLSYDFERQVRTMLDPVSFSVSRKSKQLLTDLKTLRNILINLLQRDCVSFNHFINEIRKNEEVFASNTGWLFMKEADSLFVNSKQRVFGCGDDKKGQLEENPKWRALKEIMKEINLENDKLAENQKSEGRIFVGVRDSKTSELLRQYLYKGIKFLEEKQRSEDNEGDGTSQDENDVSSSKDAVPSKVTKLGKYHDLDRQKLMSEFVSGGKKSENADVLNILSNEALVQCNEEPITIFHSYRSSHDIIRNLYRLCPRYVILYDPQVDFVRQVEVYAASIQKPVKVYFMVYKDSVEEQSFLISLQKEKLAFDKLMQEKASMAAVDMDSNKRGKLCSVDPYESVSTRKAGGAVETDDLDQTPRVIVDMREFRSDLPPMLHQRGIDIEPVTLEVGDYLLSDDLCVERKSLSDLIGSLNSGRLYTQATAMCRLYRKPILLIEFDPSKPFNMSEKGKISQDVSSSDIQTRISLLTVHFPALKIIWSEGAQQTANIFADLKHKRPEPDAAKLPGIESAENSIFDVSFDQNFNFASRDLINKLPGLTSKSETLIFENFDNFEHLSSCTEDEIKENTTRTDVASNIFEFMNHSHKSAILASRSKSDHRKAPTRFRPTKK